MIVYLDTNVYIAAKYRFNKDNFAKLRELIRGGFITILYTSATIGEVKQHIESDISAGVSKYNRVIRKELESLTETEEFGLAELQETKAITSVKRQLQDFLALDEVIKIDLNPLDAEKIIQDYFDGIPPFETKKPYEFKDAIVINAIKNYQRIIGKQIIVVSKDEGFRKAFNDEESIEVEEYLTGIFKRHYRMQELQEKIEQCITDAIEADKFEDILRQYFMDFDIDRSDYGEWECDKKEIDNMECELSYAEHENGSILAHFDIELYISTEITYRDEDTSYYDKEEHKYLVENYLTWNEHHKLVLEVDVECEMETDEDGEISIYPVEVIDDSKFRTLDLDEETLQDWDEVSTDLQEEPDLVYCHECRKVLGYDASYFDYDGNPLCDDCMVGNEHGGICPSCGRKVPHEYMNSGFCEECFKEQD